MKKPWMVIERSSKAVDGERWLLLAPSGINPHWKGCIIKWRSGGFSWVCNKIIGDGIQPETQEEIDAFISKFEALTLKRSLERSIGDPATENDSPSNKGKRL